MKYENILAAIAIYPDTAAQPAMRAIALRWQQYKAVADSTDAFVCGLEKAIKSVQASQTKLFEQIRRDCRHEIKVPTGGGRDREQCVLCFKVLDKERVIHETG